MDNIDRKYKLPPPLSTIQNGKPQPIYPLMLEHKGDNNQLFAGKYVGEIEHIYDLFYKLITCQSIDENNPLEHEAKIHNNNFYIYQNGKWVLIGDIRKPYFGAIDYMESTFDKQIDNLNYLKNEFQGIATEKTNQIIQSVEESKQALEETKANAEQASINAQSVNIRTFANVEEMKQVSNLKAGALVKTQGFYQSGDGGGADYVIVGDIGEDEVDEASIIALQKGLYAKLIINGKINLNTFGAKGDGENDDNEALQKAINFAVDNNLLLTANKNCIYCTSKELTIKGKLYSDLNFATIKAIAPMNSVVNYDDNYRLQPWYGSLQNLIIDCNSLTTTAGLLITMAQKKIMTNITVKNVSAGYGIKHVGGYEVLGLNWQVEGNGSSKTSYGIHFGGDSFFTNMLVIDCYTAFTGGNITTRIKNCHAWIKTPSLFNGSTFWYINWDASLWATDLYSDTYYYNLRFKGTAAHTNIKNLDILYNSAILNQTEQKDDIFEFLHFDTIDGVLYTRDIVIDGLSWHETGAQKFSNATRFFCGEIYNNKPLNIYCPKIQFPLQIYKPYAKNLLLNSNFSVWQRGTSQSSTGEKSADRWIFDGNGLNSIQVSKQYDVTSDNIAYCAKITVDLGSGSAGLKQVVQEGMQCLSFMPVTVSFYAKTENGDANMNVVLQGQYGSNPKKQYGSINVKVDSTQWKRYEATFYFNDNKTYFETGYPNLILYMGLLSSTTYYITNVKLEANKRSSPYENPLYIDELVRCRMYYNPSTATTENEV